MLSSRPGAVTRLHVQPDGRRWTAPRPHGQGALPSVIITERFVHYISSKESLQTTRSVMCIETYMSKTSAQPAEYEGSAVMGCAGAAETCTVRGGDQDKTGAALCDIPRMRPLSHRRAQRAAASDQLVFAYIGRLRETGDTRSQASPRFLTVSMTTGSALLMVALQRNMV